MIVFSFPPPGYFHGFGNYNYGGGFTAGYSAGLGGPGGAGGGGVKHGEKELEVSDRFLVRRTYMMYVLAVKQEVEVTS